MKSDGPLVWSTTFHDPTCPTVWIGCAAVARARIVLNRTPAFGVANAATGRITRPAIAQCTNAFALRLMCHRLRYDRHWRTKRQCISGEGFTATDERSARM